MEKLEQLRTNTEKAYQAALKAMFELVDAITEERNYYVMLESSISSSTAADTIYEEYDYDNEEGYQDGDVIEEGSAGYLIKSYKVVGTDSQGNKFEISDDRCHVRFVTRDVDWKVCSVEFIPLETFGCEEFRVFRFEVE